mmetsp:Transcript_22719/g.52082  ORF Transcript_22719/g.52082 Transcript_22719/m.52082 type:complete len:108 (-) Transcript_22719:278-601(-)
MEQNVLLLFSIFKKRVQSPDLSNCVAKNNLFLQFSWSFGRGDHFDCCKQFANEIGRKHNARLKRDTFNLQISHVKYHPSNVLNASYSRRFNKCSPNYFSSQQFWIQC